MSAQLYTFLVVGISLIVFWVSFCAYFDSAKKKYQKMLKSDITRDQMIIQEEKIRNFLDINNLKPGTDIHEIAKHLNIVDGGVDTEQQERAKLTESMVVYFKDGESIEDQRFGFAHECGHRLDEDPVPATRQYGFNKSEMEQLADYTGAALLMPIDAVYCYLEDCQYKTLKQYKRIEKVKELSSRYKVSKIHVIRRIQEVYLIKGNNS